MIDFICDHITDVGGVKCIQYHRDLSDQLASGTQVAGSGDFFFTSDEPNQSITWLPQLLGSQKISSAWHLQFLVPQDYMVLASGRLIERSVEEETSALHEYEISDAERTIPDKIGFVICQTPLSTPFDVRGKKDLGAAYFLSR